MRNPFPIIWRYIRSLIARLPWPGVIRRHPVLSGLILGTSTLIALAAFALTRPKAPEYVTDTAKRGDVTRTVEGVGSVISERDFALQFPVSGIVADVRVKEGDTVKAGQSLAALRAGVLSADVASAGAAWQSAQADLNGLLEGARPEDIAIAEAELQSKRAALDVAKMSLLTAERTLELSKEKLKSLESEARISLAGTVCAAAELDAALSVVASAAHYEEALADLTTARAAVATVADTLRQANDFLLSLPITSNFTVSVRDTNSDLLATERSSIQSALSGVDAALNNLRDASASYTTQISAEKSALASAQGEADRAKADIATYEASVNVSEAQLQLKRAGTRP